MRESLRRFEQLLEDALVEGGALLGNVFAARRAMQLDHVVGQAAIDALTSSLNSLSSARGDAIEAHRQLYRIGKILATDQLYGDDTRDAWFAEARAHRGAATGA